METIETNAALGGPTLQNFEHKNCVVFFEKMGHHRPLCVYFRSFQAIYRIKTVDFSGIRTQIVVVEGKHADHLTTTTALKNCVV